MARKGGKKKRGQIRSRKKNGYHVMNQLNFSSRAQEKVYDKLAIEYVEQHLPKVMNIVPKEVREKRGDAPFNRPGKLYKENLDTVSTKDKYVTMAKTFIKWNVIHKGISSLGEINEKNTEEFFDTIAENTGGEGKDRYSKKTYDGYVDSVYKYFAAVSKNPEDALVPIEGREFGKAIKSSKKLYNQEFRDKMRGKIGDFSQDEVKRGTGYTDRQAKIILRQALKNDKYSTQEKLAVACLVYGTFRNSELLNSSADCFDSEAKTIRMTKYGMTKQDRPRIVLDVDKKVFDLLDQYQKETGIPPSEELFNNFSQDKVRALVKECCRDGKVKYSGVHDCRKAYVERTENALFKRALKGDLTKEEMVEKILQQVGVDPSLNPEKSPKDYAWKTLKDGTKKRYRTNHGKEAAPKEPKFTKEKLLEYPIENLIDLYVAEQLGHAKTSTNQEYRIKEQKEKRRAYIKELKAQRKGDPK
ncbi:hypothetical protein NLX67_21255 [Domibacillus sp. A3M-37]|uniref:hypothetical protein n=1 Tax=Domibacillus sp. A3M-37 TaxID=2962037 RepID=UPI0020B7D4FF|nr:hypothetical protein [Domibacillus sp. A3M-37]MCP3764851.1 hypothetical protein [Domibacillus sp. A3M-37]